MRVLDGGAFAQELRIGHDGDIGIRADLTEMRSTSSPVPIGTVDLVMTTV